MRQRMPLLVAAIALAASCAVRAKDGSGPDAGAQEALEQRARARSVGTAEVGGREVEGIRHQPPLVDPVERAEVVGGGHDAPVAGRPGGGARARGAVIHAELTGYFSTADAFRVTDSHPEGRGAIACIAGALNDARLNPSDIGYINAHGTSTQVNDRVESLAIKHVFGDHAKRVPCSSIKSMMGHLIAAAGAVELITCVEAMRHGVLPPTMNYEHPDPECDLDYVPNQARKAVVNHCLSNSFGFGGQNTSLVVSRFAG